MSRLKVMLRGALISEIQLNPEKEYIGGRKDGCDIRLQAEKGISREHFKLVFADGQWQISAISRFGDVFSLGQKIEEHVNLEHNQSFQIPPYDFVFLDVPDAGLPEEKQDGIVIDMDENEKTVIGALPQMPYIKMINSTGQVIEMLRLEVGEVWVAGRDPSCQIIIPDQRVSRRQFEIYKANGGYTILDLASVNGTFLNGSPISSTDPQSLKSGDAITVLDNTMYFELHDPNFKYKVEKIEVPPIQIDQPEEIYDPSAEPYQQIDGEVPQEGQYDPSQQLVASDQYNPDAAGYDPNQYYDPNAAYDPNQYYDPNQNYYQDGQVPPEQQKPLTPLEKFKQNKPLMIGSVVLFLMVAYFVSDMLTSEPAPVQVADSSDPFSRLSPEQQKEVKELYTLAEQMYGQQKYDLTLEKIRKIEEILPTGYKDSNKIKAEADQAYQIYVQAQKEEEERRLRDELIARNKEILAKCSKLINPQITLSEIKDCLMPVIATPTDDPVVSNELTRIQAEAEKIENDRKQKEEDARVYAKQVEDLKQLFESAEKTQFSGYAFKAIKKFRKVTSSSLPDPDGLVAKAKERIAFIEEKIREKSEGSITAADNLFKEGKVKEAIRTLKEAVIYDPENKNITDKIAMFSLALKRQVQVLYQESIIDENYGVLENTESKQGALSKWKKITEMDLEDGEYYRKAVTKLRRYGVY